LSLPLPRFSPQRNHESASRRDGALIALELNAARLAVGVVLATLIAVAARRVGALSPTGSAAAVAIGASAVAAGWSWGVLLILYFVSSVALTRFRAAAKAARTGALVAKVGRRDGVQVFANGGAFALAAVLWLASGRDEWRALGAAALAAAASDTWATELGTLASRAPRSIASWARVPTGTSGGVSFPGAAAAIAGAAFVALAAVALGWPRGTAAAAFGGGIAGSTIDSLLGATVQARRWCDRCNAPTERRTHICGASTRVVGGVSWLGNDAVNALSTAAGGLMGLLLSA
jgi:uncharacterized protein (TIGR00297 family)